MCVLGCIVFSPYREARRWLREAGDMSLQVPNLDDQSFEDLVREGRALISRHADDWTNHNTADPGITILELFAYVTEMLLYQTNRITNHHLREFLRMLVGLVGEREV